MNIGMSKDELKYGYKNESHTLENMMKQEWQSYLAKHDKVYVARILNFEAKILVSDTQALFFIVNHGSPTPSG